MAEKCWYCERMISEPKYFISEIFTNQGIRPREIRTAIHKSCYDKAIREGYGHFFVRGLEE